MPESPLLRPALGSVHQGTQLQLFDPNPVYTLPEYVALCEEARRLADELDAWEQHRLVDPLS